MFQLDRWQEIFATLLQHKMRSALTAFSVAWGIFMLVALLGFGRGMQNGVESGFADDATNSLYMFTGTTSEPWDGLPVGRRIVLSNHDVEAARATTGVEHVSGRYFVGGNRHADVKLKANGKSSSFDVRAVHPDHLYLELTEMVAGRFIDEVDVAQRRKVIVIGRPVADYLWGRQDVIGEWVDVGGMMFLVVGIFDDAGGEGETNKVYLPISPAQVAWGDPDRVHMLMFTMDPSVGVAESQALSDRVKAELAAAHRFDPADRQAVRVRNNVENFDNFQKIFMMIRIFVWLMSGMTLVAGIVGVSNIMMIVVRERTKEIGIRKALGATAADIVGSIVQEAVFLTAVAGYLGLCVGVGFLALISAVLPSNDMFKNPEIDMSVAIYATIVLVIAGALAGFFPAYAAAKVNPIEALRDT